MSAFFVLGGKLQELLSERFRTVLYVIAGIIAFIVAIVLLAGYGTKASVKSETASGGKNQAKTIRVGYFPNITHSQAIVGLKKGFFSESLGKEIKIEPKVFNAGPSEIEALFANEVDLGYIGPGPAVNGYIKSNGEALRIIAGATSGGAVLVARKGSGIKDAKDLKGKRVASPQLGNTQDIALRAYLRANGLRPKDKGGNIDIQPIQNPDILSLFKRKELDAAWVPEPWGARLVKEGNGRIILDERTLWPGGRFVTANVIVSTRFLEENPELVKKFLEGHVATTSWINANQAEARTVLNSEIQALTTKALPEDVLADAFSRLEVTNDPLESSLQKGAKDAFDLGFIRSDDVKGIYDLKLLEEVVEEKNRTEKGKAANEQR